jgi:hypothetical protein
MVRRAAIPPPPIEPREFRSVEEIDFGIAKLERRVRELEELDGSTLDLLANRVRKVSFKRIS